MAIQGAIKALKAALPASAWSDDADIMAPMLLDGRGRLQGSSPFLVRPGSTSEAQEAVRICIEHNVPIVPQGGNTGLVGGGTPGLTGGQEILFSMTRINQIAAVDQDSMSLTVGAGTTLATAQQAAEDAGLLFPLSLASEGSCTIGGNIATNAGGVHVLRYGNMRALVSGVEAILPDGSLFDSLGTVAKDNTGYDLTNLFCGSEGTLGLVTRATLKLFPRPAHTLVAWLGFESIGALMTAFSDLRRQMGDSLNACEIMPSLAMQFLETHVEGARSPISADTPWHALVELASDTTASTLEDTFLEWFENAVNAGLCTSGAMASNGRERAEFWHLREHFPETQKAAGYSIKHDIGVPIAGLARYVEETLAALEKACPGIRPVPFGHAGDGNLHFNLTRPETMSDEDFAAMTPALNRLVFDKVAAAGGTFSAEHGIGTIRKDELLRYKSPSAIAAMKLIKQAIDPENLFNPGRIFDL